MFHYRSHGADYGRVLCAFENVAADATFHQHVEALGYPYVDVTTSPRSPTSFSRGERGALRHNRLSRMPLSRPSGIRLVGLVAGLPRLMSPAQSIVDGVDVQRLTGEQARRIAIRAQLLDTPRPTELVEEVVRPA